MDAEQSESLRTQDSGSVPMDVEEDLNFTAIVKPKISNGYSRKNRTSLELQKAKARKWAGQNLTKK